jgi:hypothetical protein
MSELPTHLSDIASTLRLPEDAEREVLSLVNLAYLAGRSDKALDSAIRVLTDAKREPKSELDKFGDFVDGQRACKEGRECPEDCSDEFSRGYCAERARIKAGENR